MDKTDKRLKKATDRILEIRNIHSHPINFLSGLILSYKAYSNFLNATKFDLAFIEIGLRKLSESLPEGKEKLMLKKYKSEDIVKGIKAMESLSTFEWCANKKYFRSLKREVDKPVKDITTTLITGKDIGKLTNYFQEYILRKEALQCLEDANLILKNINIL